MDVCSVTIVFGEDVCAGTVLQWMSAVTDTAVVVFTDTTVVEVVTDNALVKVFTETAVSGSFLISQSDKPKLVMFGMITVLARCVPASSSRKVA